MLDDTYNLFVLTPQQILVKDIDDHQNPINDMIRQIDNFYSQNINRLTPEQKDTLQRLSDDLRNRYDELLRKTRREITDAEDRLNQMRTDELESVRADFRKTIFLLTFLVENLIFIFFFFCIDKVCTLVIFTYEITLECRGRAV